ncbi:putative protoporphyrin oxidase [Anaerolinea thermophila UNI-1]|uniref:Protoporphyrin oxidase n=2 Tax=Anaerolinea TaxID=233189 RepID=E8MYZ4_ANATU|nr:putative protoporphyrin oxidase [Anaerolinea thermophila UNI-1]
MFFAGKIDYYTLSFFDRLITRLVAKQSGQSKPVNDLRDWEKIRRWAEEVFA